MRIEYRRDYPLSLTTPGHLELYFLGVGGAFSNALNNSNLLVMKGQFHILIDFGITGPRSLEMAAGLSPINIRAILPTHGHADHVGGIETLALMHRYVSRTKCTAILTDQFRDFLWNQTLRGGLEHNEETSLDFMDYFDVLRPISKFSNENFQTWEINYGGIHLELFRTNHVAENFPSYGLMIDNRVFFSGDSRFNPRLIDHYADRSEVMFHDCSLTPSKTHASLFDLMTLDESIRRKMWLYHYGDDFEKHDFSGFGGRAKHSTRYILD